MSNWDSLTSQLYDKRHVMQAMDDAFKEFGETVQDPSHALLAAMPSGIRFKQDAAREAYVVPLNKALMTAIREMGVPAADIVAYRFLRGGLEYFARPRNPPRRIAGMTVHEMQDAVFALENQIMVYHPDALAAVGEVMAKWTALTDATLDIALEGGLYGQLEVDHLKSAYRFYAPFIFEDQIDAAEPLLSVFHASDPDELLLRLLGSNRPISLAKMLPVSVIQLYRAIEGAEYNRNLLGLAERNNRLEGHDAALSQVQITRLGDPQLAWDNPPDADELLLWRRQALRERGNVPIVFFDQGRPYGMTFRDKYMQNLYVAAAQVPTPIMEFFFNVLNIPATAFRKGVTSFSDVFLIKEMLINPQQQIMSSLILHLPEVDGLPVSRKQLIATAGKKVGPVMAAYSRYLAGMLPQDSPWRPIIKSWEQNGGRMHFVGGLQAFDNLTGTATYARDEEAKQQLPAEVQRWINSEEDLSQVKETGRRAWKITKDMLERAENGLAMVDNIPRLALFAAMVELGVSAKVSGATARQLMDLSQTGTIAERYPILSVLQPFLSVAQTSARLGFRYIKHPYARRFLVMLTALSALTTLFMDEEDLELMESLNPHFVQARTTMTLGDGIVAVPVAHPFVPFNALGQEIARIIRGRTTVPDAAVSVLYSALVHYTPFNWSKTAVAEGHAEDVFWDLISPEVFAQLYYRVYLPARRMSEVGSENVSAQWEFFRNLMTNAAPAVDRYVKRAGALVNGNYDELADHHKLSGMMYRSRDYISRAAHAREAHRIYSEGMDDFSLSRKFIGEADARRLIAAVNRFHYRTRPTYTKDRLAAQGRKLRAMLAGRDWGTGNRMAEAISELAPHWIQGGAHMTYDPKETSATPQRIRVEWSNTDFRLDHATLGNRELPTYDDVAHNTRYATTATIKDIMDGNWQGVQYSVTRANVYQSTVLSQRSLNQARELLISTRHNLPEKVRRRALAEVLDAELDADRIYRERGKPAYDAWLELQINP